MGKFARHSQHHVLQKRLSKYPHAILISKEDYNITPLMHVADTLLSEASSASFDFLATGKTGIIYDLPPEKTLYSSGDPILYLDNREFLKDAFVHVSHPSQLRQGIERALNPTEAMRSAADQKRDYFFHQLDGNASKRTKELIEKLYEEGTHFNEPTP
jgi:CDP-glycerol glycerophosphotransferase (TagB/SpsB family)